MVNIGQTGKIYGVQIGARVTEKALTQFVDPLVPIGTGQAPHEKVSTWVQMAAGIALPMIAKKKYPQHELMAQVYGGHLFSYVADYAEYYINQMLAPAGVKNVQNLQNLNNQSFPQQTTYPGMTLPPNSGLQGVGIKSPITNGARYQRA